MSDFQDFLNTLTPEQLRQLADIKEGKEPEGKRSKRKQSRKKTIVTEDSQPQPVQTGPQRKTSSRRNKKQKRGTIDKILDKKGAPAKRLGSTPLGKRPNRFVDGDLSYLKDEEQQDIKIDQLLNLNRKPSPRMRPDRQQQFVDAVCSRCDDEFTNVPASACYKDGSVFVFTCDDCVKGLGN